MTRKVCLGCSREYTGVVLACPHDGTVLIPLAQDQLVGTKLADRYQILSVVGHGGMGVVYKARHELMEREVAIKILKADLISDSMSVKRFQQEARAACRLKHPNVITLFDFGVSPHTGQPYLVMDYLKGISLADIIKKDGHVGVDRSLRIFIQTCRALEHAHNQKVIHRDLKPGNIMLIETDDEKDFVKVVDFGVAKLIGGADDEESQRLTQTGEVCGSPVYMSPEQCMGQKLDPRSDVYSMGVVMYEALTGKLPLLGKTMVDTMSKHMSETPPPFSSVRPDLYIPERLEAVVFKVLQKDPSLRPQTMAELERELEWAVPKPGRGGALRTSIQPGSNFKLPERNSIQPGTKSIKAPAPAPAKEPEKTAGRPTGLIVAIVVALLVAVGGGLTWILTNKPATTQQAPSTASPVAPPAISPKPTLPAPRTGGSGTPAPSPNKVAPLAGSAARGARLEVDAGGPRSATVGPPTTTQPSRSSAAAPEPGRPAAKPRKLPQAKLPKPSPKRASNRQGNESSSNAAGAPAPTKPAADPFEALRRSRSY